MPDVIQGIFTPEAAPKRTKDNATFHDEYFKLSGQKTDLEKQNEPRYAKKIGGIAMEMQEQKLKMDEADLEARLLSGDLDDTQIKQTQEDLRKKREELTKHQERMVEAANAGPSGEKK